MKNKTAVFFGKFQPPHLGHIITINRILRNFNKLIVGITSDNKIGQDPNQIKKVFEEAFQDYKKISFEIIKGSIEEGTASIDHLDFDTVVSGNKKIISILNAMGHCTVFQPRSVGIGFNSSEIRSLLNNNLKEHNTERNTQFNLEFEELSKIKPLEKVLPNHLANIESMILKDGLILKPLIIDKKYNIVLDGSHRYAFLLKFGYKKAPVIKVNYDDETIFVGNDLKHRYLIDKNLKGVQWVTMFYPKNPMVEVDIIKNAIKIINKDEKKKMIITDYQFISVFKNQYDYSVTRFWYEFHGYPDKENKYYDYWKNFVLKRIAKNNLKVIYVLNPLHGDERPLENVLESCFQKVELSEKLYKLELKNC